MSEHTDGAQTADDVRKEIDQTRDQLRDTLDELSTKLDVKAQTQQRIDKARSSAVQQAHRAHDSAPKPVREAFDKSVATVGPALTNVNTQLKPHRKPIVAGLVALAVIVLVMRWRRGSS